MDPNSYTAKTNANAMSFSGAIGNIMKTIPRKINSVNYTRKRGGNTAHSGGGYGANITSIDGNKRVGDLSDSEIRTLLNDMAQKGEGTMRGKNTLGDRLNNPLNIKWTGAEWQRNLGGIDSGVKATDGGSFVKFPSVDNGYRAAQELITAPSYTSLTVEQALRRWSGAGVTSGGSTGIKDIPKIGTFSGGKGGIPQKRKELVSNKYPNLKNGTQVGQLGNITTPYGGKTKFENPHPGIDIANDIGTPIPAFAGGVVTNKTDGHIQGEKNGGNQVMIKDNQGNTHQYSHLNNLIVKEGQQVQPGQPIGTMGNTGAAYSNSGGTGSHLDYRIVNAYGKYVNPFNYIKKYL